MSSEDAGERKYRQAMTMALEEEMERDERVVLMGQDVARPGGSFGTTRGLLERFGEGRVRDSPISEQALVGAAIGAAATGLRPVAEILFFDFLGIASDQLVNQAAKIRWFSRGSVTVPVVIKAGVGTGFGMGAQHSQSLEGWYAQIPGIKVCWPSTPADAKGLMKSAIRDDDPVLFLETLSDLERARGPVGGPDDLVPLGLASVSRGGSDCTIVTYGAARRAVDKAVQLLESESVDVEVIDLRTIVPWDRETVFASVAKTNRCVVVTDAPVPYGPGSEIAAAVGEECFDDLDAPVVRVGSHPVPAPQFAQYDRLRQPSAEMIAAAVRGLS
jgi:pyruvate/2-oxoglutarate/acetoin dehydrogenase E1 component